MRPKIFQYALVGDLEPSVLSEYHNSSEACLVLVKKDTISSTVSVSKQMNPSDTQVKDYIKRLANNRVKAQLWGANPELSNLPFIELDFEDLNLEAPNLDYKVYSYNYTYKIFKPQKAKKMKRFTVHFYHRGAGYDISVSGMDITDALSKTKTILSQEAKIASIKCLTEDLSKL